MDVASTELHLAGSFFFRISDFGLQASVREPEKLIFLHQQPKTADVCCRSSPTSANSTLRSQVQSYNTHTQPHHCNLKRDNVILGAQREHSLKLNIRRYTVGTGAEKAKICGSYLSL